MNYLIPSSKPLFRSQDDPAGIISRFEEGTVYRYPGAVPLLEVRGDHARMGLQYGVLLRQEIMETLGVLREIITWMARQSGAPAELFAEMLKARALQLASKLPGRFHAEATGVARGAGIPIEAVWAVSMFIDVVEGKACTGVLMPSREGKWIHGRNNDTSSYGGSALGRIGVVVKHIPDTLHEVTHFDYPLFLGVSSGYNDQGLSHSEETLSIRQPNPDGFPLYYLIRMGMEQCSSLDQLEPLFHSHLICGASGSVWNSRAEGRGALYELTPQAWRRIDAGPGIFWDFNHIYSPDLKKYQHPRQNLVGSNWDRETLAGQFPRKDAYELQDMVDFLRLHTSNNGTDYAWCGSRWPICNFAGQQTIIFDPDGDGLYASIRSYFSASQDIFHIHNDFLKPPEPAFPEEALPDLVESAAKIENELLTRLEKIVRYKQLSDQHPQDARLHFLVGYYSYLEGDLDSFPDEVEAAYRLAPEVEEYRLCAGMAAFHQGNPDKAVELLEGIPSEHLNLEQELRRLSLLAKIMSAANLRRSKEYIQKRDAILAEQDAVEFFTSTWLPQIEKLGQ
jgi:hypothetical protein